MSDYTPTDEEVRQCYTVLRQVADDAFDLNEDEDRAEFDRWLAEHDRKVAEAAWDEAHSALCHRGLHGACENPHRAKGATSD